MAPLRKVKVVLQDNDIHAKFEEADRSFNDLYYSFKHRSRRGTFKHFLTFNASEPFALKEVINRSGPYAGHRAFVIVKANTFPFERLPPELRQQIYRLVLPAGESIYIFGDWFRRRIVRKAAILIVSHTIHDEAVEFLYRPHQFSFRSAGAFSAFLCRIGPGRKYLSHLTVMKSGHRQIEDCYINLSFVKRLQYFKIALPGSLKASLAEHIDRHWEDMSFYLLADQADHAESLRRLAIVHFDVGRTTKGTLDSDGQPIREMTEERQEWCRARLRELLREHFVAQKNSIKIKTCGSISASSSSIVEVED
ncbi:hypothetical protein Q7P37_010563 [Cladosporium fusiforme]